MSGVRLACAKAKLSKTVGNGGAATAQVSAMGTTFFIPDRFATAGDADRGYAGIWPNNQVIETWPMATAAGSARTATSC